MQPPNVARLQLWNPLTGHCVPVRDPACELREVRLMGDTLQRVDRSIRPFIVKPGCSEHLQQVGEQIDVARQLRL